MTIENGTAIVLAYVLASMGVIIAFLLAVRDRMVHRTAARAPLRTAWRGITYQAARRSSLDHARADRPRACRTAATTEDRQLPFRMDAEWTDAARFQTVNGGVKPSDAPRSIAQQSASVGLFRGWRS